MLEMSENGVSKARVQFNGHARKTLTWIANSDIRIPIHHTFVNKAGTVHSYISLISSCHSLAL
jgi:hypothetical protein